MSSEFKREMDRGYRSHLGNTEVRRRLQSLPAFNVLIDTEPFEHLLEMLADAEVKAKQGH